MKKDEQTNKEFEEAIATANNADSEIRNLYNSVSPTVLELIKEIEGVNPYTKLVAASFNNGVSATLKAFTYAFFIAGFISGIKSEQQHNINP